MDSSPGHNPTSEETKKWNADQLLEWIQQQEPTPLNDDQLEKFKAEYVPGKVFLNHASDVEFFQKQCKLAIGTSELLADLAAEIVQGETAGMKRNREQVGNAGMFNTASKKPRLESEAHAELQKLAASARRQRERIRQEIEKLDQSSVSFSEDTPRLLPNSVSQLSDPAFNTKLPFPFVGYMTPNRFNIDDKTEEKSWVYTGREKFADLINEFEHICRGSGYSALILYGTRGYGKSYLLAAVVCYLAAREVELVYIPDCREFLRRPVMYMKAAMLFAWADDESKQQTIMALDTLEEMDKFLDAQSNVIFVIDQFNTLDKRKTDDDDTSRSKGQLCRWLDSYISRHKALLSSSANNHSIHNMVSSQSSKKLMYVYGGLTRKEMDYWWKRKEKVDLGDYMKNEVEDFTGCIPLLLENCVVQLVHGKKIRLDAEFFADVDTQARAFEHEIQRRCCQSQLNERQNYMISCLSSQPVSLSSKAVPDFVDHRYFYDKYDPEARAYVGHCACGLARNAVARMLLARKVCFANQDFLRSLPQYINNPSVAAFMIELAVLSSIAFTGLKLTALTNLKIRADIIRADINRTMEVNLFQGRTPNLDSNTEDPVLHVPQAFSFRTINGVIVQKASEPEYGKIKRRLFMFPLRITVAKPDSDSREQFFSEWKQWIIGLEKFEVVPTFVWITQKGGGSTQHRKCDKWPRHYELNIPISQVNSQIWSFYNAVKRG